MATTNEVESADAEIPEDAAIKAAHPMRTGDHATYAEAMRLVGAKYSKRALVDLVNWLLVRVESDRESVRRAALEEALAQIRTVQVVDNCTSARVIEVLVRQLIQSGGK